MSDEIPPVTPPPNESEPENPPAPASVPKIIWVVVAFVPSLVALAAIKSPEVGQGTLLSLLILNFICCVVAGAGLAHSLRKMTDRIGLGFLLTAFFLIANIVIAFLIGCSQMKPI